MECSFQLSTELSGGDRLWHYRDIRQPLLPDFVSSEQDGGVCSLQASQGLWSPDGFRVPRASGLHAALPAGTGTARGKASPAPRSAGRCFMQSARTLAKARPGMCSVPPPPLGAHGDTEPLDAQGPFILPTPCLLAPLGCKFGGVSPATDSSHCPTPAQAFAGSVG